ncbi:MAG TPA: multicopper oxidase family protein [Propionibacteriaceae bacterium]|nr:multicopper oxidase family protein [Propionibacteriaceae bacterium]
MTGATTRRRLKVLLPILGALALLAPLVFMWQASLVPKRFTVQEMGYPDYGVGPGAHGPGSGHGPGAAGSVSVSSLIADPARPADKEYDLTAAAATLDIGGRAVPGFTLNGSSPGPTIEAEVGDLVEVRLRNESVPEGVALHWHGIDVPNAMDGVAGVTQDAVMVGAEFRYRFVVDRVGTYWYHSHQLSHEQVIGGLLGALVVQPKRGPVGNAVEVVAVAHTYAGVKTLNGQPGDQRVAARPGQSVRVRLINTDNGPIEVWPSGEYRALAIDGTDVHEPGVVRDYSVTVTAGGRVDLGLTMPADGSPLRVQVSKGTAVILGTGDLPAPPQPVEPLNLLAYGTPRPEGLGFDPNQPDRTFEYSIGRRPGFVRGWPGLWWSINGHTFPNVPMFMVREGDVVRMHIDDNSGEVHPMHLHGHHAVVLAHNGVRATGSPWWVDSLNVRDGETYDIAFVADNPGVWMDHCHNLEHAADGMVAHLMYEGVTTPYTIGRGTPNHPE